MSTQWVYRFGADKTEGNAKMKELLGGKGANLAEMSSLGLPVPPGFTVTTEVCTHYYSHDKTYPAALKAQVAAALTALEAQMGDQFGDPDHPLLLSVRSGARVSMPGMMDTVLNLGLNDDTVAGLAKKSGNERFAYDSYRRFIQMYGDVVLEVPHYEFEDILEQHKRDQDVTQDTELDAETLKAVVRDYKALVQKELGRPFPMDVHEQLWGAIGAVFASWLTPRAVT
ncbi:MAG TPA: PEP/pyruvate-binding domain-containing protein, partial [Micavibrio sp.]